MSETELDPDTEKKILILRLILTDWGISKSELAEVTSRSVSAVEKWLKGKNRLTTDVTDAIIRHFDLPVDFFDRPLRGRFKRPMPLDNQTIRIQYQGHVSTFTFAGEQANEQYKKLLTVVGSTSVDLSRKTNDPQ